MITRLIAFLALAWLFTCVPFFFVGDAFLDPSGEYSSEKVFWVSVVRWLALLGPPFVLGIAARVWIFKGSADLDA